MTTVGPWLPLSLLVVPTVAAVVVVLAGLFQLVFGRREVAPLPRAVVVSASAPVRLARGTTPPAHRPAPAPVPLVVPQPVRTVVASRAAIERASTMRAQPVRNAFEDDEVTSFYQRRFASR
ncbi:MAG: hypothetical protein ACM31C_19945 [Acidobacteriota bacterium]